MAHKFNRKTEQLKTKVQFVRGLVRKDAGEILTDDEADTMTDQAANDEIALGRFDVVPRETEAKGDDKSDETASGSKVVAPDVAPATGKGK